MSEQIERSPIKKILVKQLTYVGLDEYLEQELKDAGYGGVQVSEGPLGVKLTLYVTRPGLVIGRRGIGIKDISDKLTSKFNLNNIQISVAEIEVPEANPRVICERIAASMQKGTPFRRTAIWALNQIMNAGALGCEIIISGKIRSERAHYQKFVAGVVPKSGEIARVAVLKGTTSVLLKAGLFGVKVKIALKSRMTPEFQLKQVAEPVKEGEVVEKAEGEGVT
ncbi:MAG: 30S ribosomal protein S3 [Nitrososphaeria archaeon]|jgi:small subunit ribosomal protein S3